MKSSNWKRTLIAAVCVLGWSANAAAIEIISDSAPKFLKHAEVAVEVGNLERAVGLIEPRLNQLRRHTYQHRAYAALCNAYLRQLDLDSAAKACNRAVTFSAANASDLNNLGVFHYISEDFATAATYFKQAASAEPSQDYEDNLNAAITAGARTMTAQQ